MLEMEVEASEKSDYFRRLPKRIAVVGTVGVPGRYGGFETLAENLVHYYTRMSMGGHLAIYCSAKAASAALPESFERATLRYVSLEANGAQSILYDFLSLLDAVRRRDDCILVLGVSGASLLPLVRLMSTARIVTNIDGIEWRRDKWKGFARFVLRASEYFAVRFSHEVIADNEAIAQYVLERYGRRAVVIAYGGDHALGSNPDTQSTAGLPDCYALALCRIEPENNVHLILDAWKSIDVPLVVVGNWTSSSYGRTLKAHFGDHPRITLLDPVYDPGTLRAIRDRAQVYVHGHSAGGTNPSLVEMMHFGIPVVAHGCSFNRHTTENQALYFRSADDIVDAMRALDEPTRNRIASAMCEIAKRRYVWDKIAAQYFALLAS